MIASGTVVEVGKLDGEDGALGFVIQRANGEFITVKGLALDETRAAAALFYQAVTIRLEAPP